MDWKSALRSLAALALGYAIIVVITSYGFELVHGKGSLWGSSPLVLFEGTIVAVLAGLIGGFIAGLIGPRKGLFNSALVLIPLMVDTTYVLFFFHSTAPWWFDLIGSGTLMVCTLLGGLLTEPVRRLVQRP
jgi:hypothetical protein